MEIILIVIVIFCFVAAIIKALSGNSSTNTATPPSLTSEQTEWLQKIGLIFAQNKALSWSDIFVECGMSKDVAFSKNKELISTHFPFNKDETKHDGYDVFMTYLFAISNRYKLQHNPLSTINANEYGLNLQKGEMLYHRINNVILHSEKVTHYNLAYSGMKWQSGFLRAGTMSVIGNEIKRFVPMDIGRLFITNKRILFVGNQKHITKSIPIISILFCNLYQDGVLVNIPNQKPTLFKFETGYNSTFLSVADGLNEFITVLNRVMLGTENKELP